MYRHAHSTGMCRSQDAFLSCFSTFSLWDKISHWIYRLLSGLHWLLRDPQGSSLSLSSVYKVFDTLLHWLLHDCWASELRLTCLNSRNYTYWSVSSAFLNGYKVDFQMSHHRQVSQEYTNELDLVILQYIHVYKHHIVSHKQLPIKNFKTEILK